MERSMFGFFSNINQFIYMYTFISLYIDYNNKIPKTFLNNNIIVIDAIYKLAKKNK